MYALDAKGFNTAPFGLSLSLNPFNSSEYLMFAGHGGTSLPKEYYDQPIRVSDVCGAWWYLAAQGVLRPAQ